MKILHLSNVFGSERGGGIHEVVLSYLKIQNQSHIDVELWFPGYESEGTEIAKNIKSQSTNRSLNQIKDIIGYSP